MANPQIENGYTAVANEILDNLYKFSLNGTELKVISCIFRYTFGFHRKSHKLSASFIARWGNCDLRAVKRALKKLQQDRIIICINSEQRGVTAELMFNKNYEQWCTGGENVTGGQNVTGVVVKMSPEPVVKMTHKKIKKENKNINKKYYDDFFEKVWRTYPRKLGKSAVTQKAKKELYEAGEKVVLGAINSYIAEMVQKLGEYGVSAEKATQILEQYGAQAGVSSAFVEEMTGKVQALGKGFSESSSTIDTSSITVKESIRGIRSVLYDLSVSSSEYAGTYRGVLEVFNNTSGSAANAQDAFNIVYNALKETGVPLDELNKKLAQEFPSAAQATKSSVDSSIVEAQKTVSSSTGKMKTDAETNLAGVKKAAEDASGSVNTTTVTNWGNSASEVKKNLDKMKQTANLKLGEMQKTVESHFSGQYNTMTKKWEKACERIGQLITQMVRSTKDSLNGLARNMNTIGNEMSNNLINGISGAVTGIAGILNEVVSKVNSTISNVNSSLYSRLANKMAGINKRDEATVMQLNNLSLMENIILHEVDLGIMRGKHYQEIYKDCKERLETVKDLAYLEAV